MNLRLRMVRCGGQLRRLQRWLRRSGWLPALAVAAVLAAQGVAAGILGFVDASSAATYGARLRGVAFIISGLVLLVGAVGGLAFRSARTPAGLLALAGSAVGFVAASYLLAVTVLNAGGNATASVSIWVMPALADVLCGVALLRVGLRVPYPKRVATALLLPGLLAGANVVRDLWNPATGDVKVSSNVQLHDGTRSADSKSAAIPVEVSITNDGAMPVYVLGSIYSVVGRRASLLSSPQSAEKQALAIRAGAAASRDYSVSGYDLLQAEQGPASLGQRLLPGQTVSTTYLAEIRLPTAYDAIGVNQRFIVVRADRVGLPSAYSSSYADSWDDTGRHQRNAPSWVAGDSDDFVEHFASLHSLSQVDRLTRRGQQLRLWWVLSAPRLDHPVGPYLQAVLVADPASAEGYDAEPTTDDYDHWQDQYGYNDLESGLVQRSLSDLKIDVPSS